MYFVLLLGNFNSADARNCSNRGANVEFNTAMFLQVTKKSFALNQVWNYIYIVLDLYGMYFPILSTMSCSY